MDPYDFEQDLNLRRKKKKPKPFAFRRSKKRKKTAAVKPHQSTSLCSDAGEKCHLYCLLYGQECRGSASPKQHCKNLYYVLQPIQSDMFTFSYLSISHQRYNFIVLILSQVAFCRGSMSYSSIFRNIVAVSKSAFLGKTVVRHVFYMVMSCLFAIGVLICLLVSFDLWLYLYRHWRII